LHKGKSVFYVVSTVLKAFKGLYRKKIFMSLAFCKYLRVYFKHFIWKYKFLIKINIEFLCTEMYNYKINCQINSIFLLQKSFWLGGYLNGKCRNYRSYRYVGTEIVRLLQNHPDINITSVVSHNFAGQKISDIYQILRMFLKWNAMSLI